MEPKYWEADQRIQAFAREYMPTQLAGRYFASGLSGDAGQKSKEIGIGQTIVNMFFQTIGKDFLSRHKNDNYEKFRSALVHDLKEMAKIAKYMESTKRFEESGSVVFVDTFFRQSLKMPFGKKMRECWLNARFAAKWADGKPKQIGEFIARPTTLAHVETPLSVEIFNKEGHRIASIGYLLYHKNGILRALITNIQGVKGTRKDLEKLNGTLGENWRVNLVKQFVEKAARKKIIIEGKLPPLYGAIIPASSPKEHKRQIRQYRQTYRKAGLRKFGKKEELWRFAPKRKRLPV